jgi:hypothetical protein
MRLVAKATPEMYKGVNGAVNCAKAINKRIEDLGLKAGAKDGQIGIVCYPVTSTMVSVEFNGPRNKKLLLYAPRACFKKVAEFHVGQQVILARSVYTNMMKLTSREAYDMNLETKRFGLVEGKSVGTVTAIDTPYDQACVMFDDDVEIERPCECFEAYDELVEARKPVLPKMPKKRKVKLQLA